MRPLIIFDFDGTINDSVDTQISAWNEIAERHGYKQAEDREFVRNNSSGAWLKKSGVPIWKIPTLIKQARKEFHERLKQDKPIQHMDELIKKYSEKADLAIISSNDEEIIQTILKKHGLLNYFIHIKQGSLFGKNRDIKKIRKQLNIKKHFIVYIGDETRDIHAARRAGVISIAVTWGMQGEEILLRAKPTMMARTVRELDELLYAWVKSRF